MRSRFVAVAVLCVALTASGCATFQARKHFSAGKKAEAAGDMVTAVKEYSFAAEAQPKNEKYTSALKAARDSATNEYRNAAQAAEKQGKWKEALKQWERAIGVNPKNPELKARAELARLRTKRSEPIEFYNATRKLAAALPNDVATQQALAKAKTTAIRYYVRLAETYTDAGASKKAFEAYEKAKKIDPNAEVFKTPMYRMTMAKQHEVHGDELAAKGDMVGAFRSYEKAKALADLPGLARKMRKAKRGAGSSLEQIEQARAFERLKQWEDAAELYTLILDKGDSAPELVAAARIARKNSATIRANRALVMAKKGKSDQATASLDLALEHTDADDTFLALAKKGVEALRTQDPGLAREKFTASKASAPEIPIAEAGIQSAQALAKSMYEKAKSIAADDAAGAMVIISKLDPYKKELRGFKATRKALVKKAFADLLKQAEERAKEGNDLRAAELIATALDVANPPKKIKAPLLAGTTALRTGDYATAESVFQRILDTDKRSRIAKTGKRIAVMRRLAKLRREAQEAVDVADPIRAATAFRAILSIEPNDADAQTGLASLKSQLISESLRSAESHEQAGRPGAAFVYYQRALDLDPANSDANAAVSKLSASFDRRERPLAWVAPVIRGNRLGGACPGAENDLRERIVLYLTRTRRLGVDVMPRAEMLMVDGGEKTKPAVEIVAALEHCGVNAAGGQSVATMQVRIGTEAMFSGKVTGKFDASAVPKDEIEDGLDKDKVLDSVLNANARDIAQMVSKNNQKLKRWREVEARARMRSNDEEAVARVYAKLRMDKERLSPGEQSALRELERFILNRFR